MVLLKISIYDLIMKTYFTADPHYGHSNIIKYCKRPFSNVSEMNESMIANWNNVVQNDDDLVYILGDFCNYRDNRSAGIFHRLRGRKILIIGNHDYENHTTLNLPWEKIADYLEVVVDHQRLVLQHYPLMTWNKIGKGALQLYGHLHGRLPGTDKAQDVGVDVFGFKPVSLQDIMRRMRRNPAHPRLPLVNDNNEDNLSLTSRPRP